MTLSLQLPPEADFQEAIAAIRQGFADADAGRTVALEDFVAQSSARREENGFFRGNSVSVSPEAAEP